MKETLKSIGKVFLREMQLILHRPIYLYCMVIIPVFCYIFFTTLMGEGLPENLPVGVVDLDNTSTTRKIVRNLDAFQLTDITGHYSSVTEARKAMQRGEIYAFFYIPRHTTEEALSSRQPTISYYTNNSFLIAGALLNKEMKMMCELASGSVTTSTLSAKGVSTQQAMAFVQPIAIQSHALNNPWLNYSVYLCNTLLPGMIMLMIFLLSVYSIGNEIKQGTATEWLRTSNNNIVIALVGKFLPQTLIFLIVTILYDVVLFGFYHFPCNSGIWPMVGAALLLVLSSQAFGIFIFGMVPAMRLAMSTVSLWGMLSISISGFTFPAIAMSPILQAVNTLFPLRHYFLIYVNLALNGYPASYCWPQYAALLVFILLPFLVLKRLKVALASYRYIP